MTARSVQTDITMIVLFCLVKVDSACRMYLKCHIHVKLEKEPEISTSEMIKWIKTGQQTFDINHIKAITLFQFTNRNMTKFREQGTLDRKKGSGGSNKTPGKTVGRIKKLIINEKARSSRCMAAKVGVSHMTVRGGGLTGQVYAHTVTKHAVQKLYGNHADWQDDPARIHRTAEALQACKAFSACIPHDVQAPKMTDVWPLGMYGPLSSRWLKSSGPKLRLSSRESSPRCGKRLMRTRSCASN